MGNSSLWRTAYCRFTKGTDEGIVTSAGYSHYHLCDKRVCSSKINTDRDGILFVIDEQVHHRQNVIDKENGIAYGSFQDDLKRQDGEY